MRADDALRDISCVARKVSRKADFVLLFVSLSFCRTREAKNE
jgi:hypothetical protein